MSIITNTFTNPRERAQAIGVWGAVIGISMALGPIVGGALVDSVGWRSIFWINVPIALLAVVLTLRYIPESKAPRPRRTDAVGQLLVALLLASLTYGIIEGPEAGWTATRILVAFSLAVVSLAGILLYEPRREEPLVNLRFFRSLPFAGATVIAVAAFASLGGFLFVNTLYLQESRGLSPLEAGLDTLPMALMAMVLAPLSGRIVGRRGPRVPLVLAGLGLAASGVMLTRLTADTSFTWLFCSYFVFGIGFGFVNAPITNTAVSGMPRAQAGVAAAIASTSRQTGQTLGVAVVGALVTAGVHGGLRTELPAASHAAWWVLAGCGVAVLGLGLLSTSARARASARRTAEELNPEAIEAPV
jgi:EmrB/QacA subfamily drug resistance transporter